MALDYDILDKKPTITVNNEKFQNLVAKTYNDKIDLTNSITFTTVTHEYIGRPDLVSLAIYGNDKYADILCKLNGISNPFELNEGMELICPSSVLIDKLADITDTEVDDTIIDDDTAIVQKKNNNKKAYNELRSPNEATITDHNYTVTDDNMLVLY